MEVAVAAVGRLDGRGLVAEPACPHSVGLPACGEIHTQVEYQETLFSTPLLNDI